MEAETGGKQAQRNADSHQRLEESKKDSPLETSKGIWPCGHFDFRLLASKTMKE